MPTPQPKKKAPAPAPAPSQDFAEGSLIAQLLHQQRAIDAAQQQAAQQEAMRRQQMQARQRGALPMNQGIVPDATTVLQNRMRGAGVQ